MTVSKVNSKNLEVYQGDDETFLFRFSTDGTAVDLTGYSIKLECAFPMLNRDATILDQTTDRGYYRFDFVPSDTNGLGITKTTYDMVFIDTDGKRKTRLRGNLIITEGVPYE